MSSFLYMICKGTADPNLNKTTINKRTIKVVESEAAAWQILSDKAQAGMRRERDVRISLAMLDDGGPGWSMNCADHACDMLILCRYPEGRVTVVGQLKWSRTGYEMKVPLRPSNLPNKPGTCIYSRCMIRKNAIMKAYYGSK